MRKLILILGLLLLVGCAQNERTIDDFEALDCDNALGTYQMATTDRNRIETIRSLAYIDTSCKLKDIYCNYDIDIVQPITNTGSTTIVINSANPECVAPGTYTNCKARQTDKYSLISCGHQFVDSDFWQISLVSEDNL